MASCALEFYKTLWGVEQPLEQLFPTLSSKGFAGIEACLLYVSEENKDLIKRWCADGKLKVVLMLQSGGKSVSAHLASLEAQIVEAMQYNPVKLNIHGGRDSWTWEETCEYFTGFLALEKKYNDLRLSEGLAAVPMLHETHRGRILYAPWVALRVMQAFPALLYTADLSHWVVVSERHLNFDEFDEVMKLVCERSRHIHARPSSTQHIQLHDLEDSAFEPDLTAFKSYWRSIIATQIARGNSITVDPEFGPFPYALSGLIVGNSEASLDINIQKTIEIVTQIYNDCLREKL